VYQIGYPRHITPYANKQAAYPELALPDLPKGLNTFWKFDDAVTAPLHGFAGVHDYYQQSSARSYLPAIKTPTHLLYALNDPFFSPKVLPNKQESSPAVQLHTPKYGGHVGFIEQAGSADFVHWLDRQLVNWFQPLLR